MWLLTGSLFLGQSKKTKKDKEIAKKQEQEKLASPDDKIRLRAEISKLQDEAIELVGQISHLNSQIKILESSQRKYEDMLSSAVDYKKTLEERYKDLKDGDKALFNQIKSEQERHNEIQKNIEEINQKIEKIEIERDLYKTLKEKYREMHNRMTTYEKEHEASAGNIVKWGFKAFDKVTDLFPAKLAFKTLGKAVSVTRKFAQGITKASVVLHEGHRLWHIYNEVANENKESALMITKETLDSYLNDIKRDLAKLDADYKDYEKRAPKMPKYRVI
ncbi:hypothetical Protein psc5_04940 [Candidatus Phytoplasma solani]